MAVKLNDLMYANTKTPYIDEYNRLATNLRNQRATDIAGMEQRRDDDLAKSNAGYDKTATQNWVNYMQAQKRLPSELNSLGIRGGATESSLIRLGTNYGTNVATNESARQTAANDIRKAYAQQIADYDADLNNRLYQAESTARQNQLNWEKEQLDKDLERFSGVIEGLYGSKKGYKKLIQRLKNSNDPNKAYKIMLARRAMNQLNSSSGGGGGSYGGGGRRSYGGGGYGGGDYGDTAVPDVGNTVNNTIGTLQSVANSINKKKATTTNKKKSIKGDTYYVTNRGSYRASR